MALNFEQFAPTRAPLAAAPKADKPKAQFWINVGYVAEYNEVVDGVSTAAQRFIALPLGIPLDTQEKKPMTKNPAFNMFLSAQNDLIDQLMAAAKNMAPGAEKIIGDPTGLCIQLRRVGEEVEAPSAQDNPFAKALAL